MSRFLLSCALLATMIGCGGTPATDYTDHSQDSERFAQNVKQVALSSIKEAQSSREPADSLAAIVSMLDGALSSSKAPVGQYKDVYTAMLENSRSLHEACEAADGPTSDLKSRLAELQALAEQLPGEVQLARR